MQEPPIRSHELLEQLIREQQATRKAVEHLAKQSDRIERHGFTMAWHSWLLAVSCGLVVLMLIGILQGCPVTIVVPAH